jgi:hypothetical protein
MKSRMDIATRAGQNEWLTREALRDLIHEFKGDRLKLEATLSLWLEEEIAAYINPKEPTS